MSTVDLLVPPLFVPFSPAVNPHAAVLEEDLAAWLDETGLAADKATARRVHAARFGELVAAAYPQARCPELLLIGRLIVWMFIYDDHFDTHRWGRSCQKVSEAADMVAGILGKSGPDHAGEPLWLSLQELWHRDFRVIDPQLKVRIEKHLLVFAGGVEQEVAMRVGHEMPSSDVYIDLRLATFAWLVLVDLVEFAVGRAVPLSVAGSEAYAEMIDAAGRLMFLINDLHSLKKELASGETHNIVLVLQRERGADLDRAIALAVDLFQDDLVHFTELKTRLHKIPLSRKGCQVVSRHIRALEHLIRGELDWCRRSARYSADSMPAKVVPIVGERPAP